MAAFLAQATQLASFQARVAVIESLFTAGRIGPAQRRELLIHARDLTEIPKLASLIREKPPGSTKLARLTEEEHREHRLAVRRKWREKRAAGQGQEGAVHG
ncbi:hypothetical protein ABNQ39_07165 [Azospirillum sp. A26]|uniref:hypothetical protein n=1 Tax=Azospirillum sp. A26 TaxID=3160607 RepID=UPI00366B323C